jgi:tetratricopeptide (TPR) repeat protein
MKGSRQKGRPGRAAVKSNGPAPAPALNSARRGGTGRAAIFACVALISIVAAVYAPVRHFDFVTWDDPQYVTDNQYVTQGLTKDDVVWALTTGHAGYWVPLIWLSHMLDVQLYGMNAGMHHVTNVLLHIASTMLLFGLFYRMSGSWARSAFVAGVFGVHPLHVESVAWITERKDVLSTFFGLLALWAYVEYVRRRRVSRYLLVLLLFAFALMAKPMWVTLPFMLLLLDVWPLGRVKLTALSWSQRAVWLPLLREKVPMAAVALISSIATYFLQKAYGAVNGFEGFPLGLRLSNVLVSYVAYIRDMLWPAGLAAFYPYPPSIPLWQALGGLFALTGFSVMIARAARRCPYLVVGWLWFLGTLVPVIGLVQSGGQARADRFMYVPLIGLLIILAWGVPDALAHWRAKNIVLPAAAGVAILAFAVVARTQVRTWENSLILWRRATEVTSGNYRAHGLLGQALARQGKLQEAIPEYYEALRIRGDFEEIRNALGSALLDLGKLDEAVAQFSEAARLDPKSAQIHNGWAGALARQGKLDGAAAHYREAIRIRPDYSDAHNGLGAVLADQGKLQDAIAEYREALRIDPRSAQAHNNLGTALADQGNDDGAVQEFLESLRIAPDSNTHYNLGVILIRRGRAEEAAHHFETALQINPNNQSARLGLAQVKDSSGK